MKEFKLYFSFANKTIERWVRNLLGLIVASLVAVLTPITEKNPSRLLSATTPFVISMTRITVAVLTWALVVRMANVEVGMGWPEATLGIALVFALPMLHALERVSPEAVVEFGKSIISRFGIGDVGKGAASAAEIRARRQVTDGTEDASKVAQVHND